jgi:XTP/dITP diphosphohydrolase
MRIVLATGNPGKIKEFGEMFATLDMEVVALSRFTSSSAAETGLTFIENAILKARFAAQASGLPAIADDSGLEVDSLRGAPGIYSARYAGEGASDEDNLQKLLDAVRALDAQPRTARYQCALAFMRWETDPSPLVCQASWDGEIVLERRGQGGFGYDPIFRVAGDSRTAAELSSSEKHRISHRGKALRMMLEMLKRAA